MSALRFRLLLQVLHAPLILKSPLLAFPRQLWTLGLADAVFPRWGAKDHKIHKQGDRLPLLPLLVPPSSVPALRGNILIFIAALGRPRTHLYGLWLSQLAKSWLETTASLGLLH